MQDTSNMLARWAIALQDYDFTVKHVPGNSMRYIYIVRGTRTGQQTSHEVITSKKCILQ